MFLAVLGVIGFTVLGQTDDVYAANENVTVTYKTLDADGNEVADPNVAGTLEYRGDKIENGVPFTLWGTDNYARIYHNLTEGYAVYDYTVTGDHSSDYDADGAINVYGITSDIAITITFKETKIIDPININIPKLKCGTEIKVVENDGNYTQTPTPGITKDTGYETYETEWWDYSWQGFFNNPDYSSSSYDPENLFAGKVTKDSDIWAKVLIRPEPGCDFNIDWYEYEFYGSITVNGKSSPESKGYAISGSLCVMAKVDPDDIEHDWDNGTVTKEPTASKTGIKTYSCKGCGETKTEVIPAKGGSDPTPSKAVSGTLMAKMTAKGSKSLTVKWTKLNNVSGYDVFMAKCDQNGKKYVPKKVKTIKGNKTFTWTRSGLQKSIAYKAYVKAYVMKNGKKSYVKKSPLIHACTSGSTKNFTNAKSVTVNKTKVSLEKGKTFKIKASVEKLDNDKKFLPTSHAVKIRYKSTNTKIATVSKYGKIKAVSKGKCKVYVYAINGIWKTVTVTVK